MFVYQDFNQEEKNIAIEKSLSFEDDYRTRTYFFTNDNSLNESIETIKTIKKTHYEPSDTAIIVGPGAFLSMLNILPKNIIFADNDSVMLTWQKITIDTLMECNTPTEFVEKLNLNTERRIIIDLLDDEMNSLGDKHFLYSLANYEYAKKHIKEYSIKYILFDFTKAEDILMLTGLLSSINSKLVFLNLTNLHKYIQFIRRENELPDNIDDELKLIKYLPISSEAIFLTRNLEKEDPYLSPFVGLDAYLKLFNK